MGPKMKSNGGKIAWGAVCKPKELLDLKIPHSCSWSWRKILQLRHHARHFIKHLIGNGIDTSFWFDNWSARGPLCLRFSSTILSLLGIDENTSMANFIVNNGWNFPPALLSVIPKLNSIQQPVPHRKDKLIWTVSPFDSFSLKHTISHLMDHGPLVPWYNLVWHTASIPRMKFNMWLAVQSRLPTLDSQAMVHHGNTCVLCGIEIESHSHLFFRCDFSAPLWEFIQARCRFYNYFLIWEDMILWISSRWKSNSPMNILRKISLSALVYHTWEERNNRIFRGNPSTQNRVLTKTSSPSTRLRCGGSLLHHRKLRLPELVSVLQVALVEGWVALGLYFL
ncbi:uncharacterized protein LOC132313980 [Cornus florida]|uniref:uncharacterized protein LOC132313980 n=1 Tax=Cornus florida TaxID=4283 RepID=UPI0028A07504|nr:uncharacterized protein LOC132313980 [Cornus florida]